MDVYCRCPLISIVRVLPQHLRLTELISRTPPHDCRHTFSMLCERYGVRENDRKRMIGHAFKDDVTNAVYGHRTVEDLRAEIEKIQIPTPEAHL